MHESGLTEQLAQVCTGPWSCARQYAGPEISQELMLMSDSLFHAPAAIGRYVDRNFQGQTHAIRLQTSAVPTSSMDKRNEQTVTFRSLQS